MDELKTFGLDAETQAKLKDNFARVFEKIENARIKAGRSDKITLVAATKYASAEEINYAVSNLGLESIGENRVQALTEKYDSLVKPLDIQFIGSLQTNKVKYIAGKVSLIQSLDSLRLAKEIDSQSKKLGIISDALLEINIGGEENKGGISPDEVSSILEGLGEYKNVRIRGVMTMAPVWSTQDDYRRFFTSTYDIYTSKVLPMIGCGEDKPILSMGMSESYEAAIECGATMVRVGSALFR